MANGFQPNITENLSGVSGITGSLWTDIGDALKNPNMMNALATAGAGFSEMGRDKESIGVGEILGQVAGQFIRNKAFQEETLAQKGAKDDIMSQVLDLLKGGSKGFSDPTKSGPTKATIDGNKISLDLTGPTEDTSIVQDAQVEPTPSRFATDPNTANIKANQPNNLFAEGGEQIRRNIELSNKIGGTETSPFLKLPGGSRGTFSPLYSALLGE